MVTSTAHSGESFYREDGAWIDLTSYDESANFCIKVLTDDLWFDLSPHEGMRSTGPEGGPFSPDSLLYTLTYHGADDVPYRVLTDPEVDWLTLDGDVGGALQVDVPIEVSVAVNANASLLEPGVHTATVVFDTDSPYLGDVHRTVTLAVGGAVTYYAWALDEDPGWAREGQWAFGQPTGSGGQNGYPDPTSGHTGDNVFGYNLSGDYPGNIPEMNLTTGPINCSGLSLVTLRFWRWLGIEVPWFDHAYVRVSTDGVTWTDVWQNEMEIADGEWTPEELDISDIADDQETVYIRWTMGATDWTNTYCGWNIDDIEIAAYEVIPPVTPETVTELRLGPPVPNPFNSKTAIEFIAPKDGRVRAFVYSFAGRIVRTLPLIRCVAGPNSMTWDGRNNNGQHVASGVYVVRVETGGETATQKVVLIR